jgi:hypothetical protein
MQIEKTTDPITEKRLALKQQRHEILTLAPQAALTAILEAPQPAPLVHSFPAEDLHLLVQEIGPTDALPLIALASANQWEYFLDMEGWGRDRLHMAELTRWMHHLLKADPKRFARWCMAEKLDLAELYLHHNIEVVVREYDQTPSELGQGFTSDDETFYWRLRDLPAAIKEAFPGLAAQREEMMGEWLKGLSAEDHVRYQNMLAESAALITAEAEEEAYRLRTVRLAEKGFLPFDEAVGVYQPLTPEALLRRDTKTLHPDEGFATSLPVPRATAPPQDDGIFASALAGVTATSALLQLQAEFANLCNQVIVADQVAVSERSVLSAVVAKVSGYLGIGLEMVCEIATGDGDLRAATDLVQRYRLADLFRVGCGAGQALKWQCERWHRESWFRHNGLPLSFWEEAGLGILGGLLIKRPLYFDNYRRGVLYREFGTLAEIRQTKAALNALIALDNLLSLLAIEIDERIEERLLTYRSLLLTAWALSSVTQGEVPLRYAPIAVSDFTAFYNALWVTDAKPRKVNETAKSRFIGWLATHSHLRETEIVDVLGAEFERLFADLAEELGPVVGSELDPRFVTLFTLKAG